MSLLLSTVIVDPVWPIKCILHPLATCNNPLRKVRSCLVCQAGPVPIGTVKNVKVS